MKEIHRGIEVIREEWAKREFKEKPGDVDIHTANERRLGEIIGRHVAGKVGIGRSRNDQVVTDTDLKIYCRDSLGNLSCILKGLIQNILKRAENEIEVSMPEYTHLQSAQPIRWSHGSVRTQRISQNFERLRQIK